MTSSIVSTGEWISLRRKAFDMTQRELAERTNCSLATIKKIESDERRPSRELAELIAAALRISADHIATFVDCVRGVRPIEVLDQIRNSDRGKDNSLASVPALTLPAPSTPFIGREMELNQIATYLDGPACRLLTLVGPGGIGKTRLAYQAAASTIGFRSGVVAVALAGVNGPDYLLPTIVERLKLPPSGSNGTKEQLLNFLHPKHLLLVLDNLEHLLDGVALLGDILSAAPGVKILATSRERLNLNSEWLFPVKGLPFPTDADQANAESSDAVQLFERCARRAWPGFRLEENLTASIRVCELVEGMPLAIELAASWVRQMRCEQIVEEVQHDLNFLSTGWRDMPERHRSIRALFEHSWRLLSVEEQDVMMRLSVFRSGFELDPAQQVAGASLMLLSALEDKSLVQRSSSGRYDLHELVRQYAASRLTEAGNTHEIQNRHLDYFLTWVEAADNQLHGPQQVTWTRRIKTEYDNLRAALGWAFGGGSAEQGLLVTTRLWFYWFRWSGNWGEGVKWIAHGLAQTEGITLLRADALFFAGTLAGQLGDRRTAHDYMQSGFEYAQQLGYQGGMVRYSMAMSFMMPDYGAVAAQFERSIAYLRENGPRFTLTTALFLSGDRARVQGDLDRAEALYNESFQISKADQDLTVIVALLARLGRLAVLKGDYEKAQHFYEQSIEKARQLDNPLELGEFLVPFSALSIYQGDFDSAERHLKEAVVLGEEFNNFGTKVHTKYYLAELALHRQELLHAARLLLESLSMTLDDRDWQRDFTNHEFNTERLMIAGKLACALVNDEEAVGLLSAAEAVRAQSGFMVDPLPRTEYEQAIQIVRKRLGDETFDLLWQAGLHLSEEAALRRAVAFLEDVLTPG